MALRGLVVFVFALGALAQPRPSTLEVGPPPDNSRGGRVCLYETRGSGNHKICITAANMSTDAMLTLPSDNSGDGFLKKTGGTLSWSTSAGDFMTNNTSEVLPPAVRKDMGILTARSEFYVRGANDGRQVVSILTASIGSVGSSLERAKMIFADVGPSTYDPKLELGIDPVNANPLVDLAYAGQTTKLRAGQITINGNGGLTGTCGAGEVWAVQEITGGIVTSGPCNTIGDFTTFTVRGAEYYVNDAVEGDLAVMSTSSVGAAKAGAISLYYSWTALSVFLEAVSIGYTGTPIAAGYITVRNIGGDSATLSPQGMFIGGYNPFNGTCPVGFVPRFIGGIAVECVSL